MSDLHNLPDYLDLDTSDSFPWARPVSKRRCVPRRIYNVSDAIDRALGLTPQMEKENDMKIGEHFRQGDTLIRRIAEVPKSAKEMKRDPHNRIILAEGERTGHAHTFRDKGICSFTTLDNSDVEFLLVGGSGATLRHELVSGKKAEHDAINIPAGAYEAAQQVEHSPAEIIRVAD